MPSASGEPHAFGRAAALIGRTRLARNIAVGLYGQTGQLAIQLISVPIMIGAWGLSDYGIWLMLFTVPAYLAMADLGFASAASNDMIAAVARGDRDGAAATFRALRLGVGGVALALFALVAALVLLAFPAMLDFAQGAADGRARTTLLLLAGYGLLSVVSGVTVGGFRAVDGYAAIGTLFSTLYLLEAAAALAVVIAGGALWQVALAFFAMRAAGTIVAGTWLYIRAPWLTKWRRQALGPELRRLARPALAAMLLPAAYATALQGSVLALGAAAGASAVPAFTTVRTLTRLALQFSFIVNVASMQRYTVADATANVARKGQLVFVNLLTSAALLLPAAPLVLFAGAPVVQFWTGGLIRPDFALLLPLTLAMLLNGVWVPLSNFLFSINRHASYTYFYLAAAVVAVGIGYLLARRLGPEGMAWAMLLLDGATSLWVWRLAVHHRVIDRAALHGASATAGAVLRSALKGTGR